MTESTGPEAMRLGAEFRLSLNPSCLLTYRIGSVHGVVARTKSPRVSKMLCIYHLLRASLVAQRVKHLPAMWETRVQSLGWEDPVEKAMATPPQYSCLENSHDRGAWWATVHGVAKNPT